MRLRFQFAIPVVCCLALGLTACGGGGNGGGSAGGSGGGSAGGSGGGSAGGTAGGSAGGGSAGGGATYTAAIFAGSATTGVANGTGTAAQFTGLDGIVLDAAGNLYVSDGSWIRKITPGAVVSGFAGAAATQGSANGTGAAASFDNPNQLAIDSSGNLYVADSSNGLIRKITTPGAVVTTIAGVAQATGTSNGACATAKFNNPTGIAVDKAGDIYVADQANNQIRKIVTASCTVSLFAGSSSGASGYVAGTGTAARFEGPSALTIDSAGNLYVIDQEGEALRMITPAGVVTNYAGNPSHGCSTDGTGIAATFCQLIGIAIDAHDNLFAVDYFNGEVREIAPGAVVTTLPITSAANGGISPYGMGIDAAGDLFISQEDLIVEMKP